MPSLPTHIIALCLPIAAIAQERVTIDGILSDGTPPPPPPPKAQHEFKVISTEEIPLEQRKMIVRCTEEIPLEQRKMIVRRVEDPGFPDPTPPAPAVIDPTTVAAFKNSPAYLDWQEKQTHTTNLFLSASVVDHRATLLRWWEDGKEYQAWSNLDFKYLTGFASFSKGERQFVTFMGVGDVSSSALRDDSMFVIPTDLPTGVPDFRMVQGVAGESEGYDAIVALHELYATDGERLRTAYELREARQKAAEEELRRILRFLRTLF